MRPPSARKIAYHDSVHGEVRSDVYHWLQDKDDPKVIAYLTAENNYYDAVMRPLADQVNELFTETVARIPQMENSVPIQHGNYSALSPRLPSPSRVRCNPKNLNTPSHANWTNKQGHPTCFRISFSISNTRTGGAVSPIQRGHRWSVLVSPRPPQRLGSPTAAAPGRSSPRPKRPGRTSCP